MCPIFTRVKALPFKAQTQLAWLAGGDTFFGSERRKRARVREWSGVNTPPCHAVVSSQKGGPGGSYACKHVGARAS